jgi:inner membrane protein
VRGPSHVVFGLAGAVAIDSFVEWSGPPVFGVGAHPTTGLLIAKGVFYAFAALGALTPDIDNARSTLGQKLGVLSRGIQHLAGHRTIFHSLLGLFMMGALVIGVQFGIGELLLRNGYTDAAHLLHVGLPPEAFLASGPGLALLGLLTGYFLHLVADSLTEGGVPWLFPWRERFGFPPNRHWRFKTGSVWEPLTVALVCLLVVAGIYFNVLHI